ncbi:MAG: META domain-containing protein, partial [Candidatus Limnocylindrales bacterium]
LAAPQRHPAMNRLALLALTVVLAACSGGSPSPSPSPSPSETPGATPSASASPSPTDVTASVVDRAFLSTRVTRDGDEIQLVTGTRISLSFTVDQLGVQAGCNIMSGVYTLDRDVLVADSLAMTEMGCDQPRHSQDDWVASLISSRPTLALSGNDLTLTQDGVVITLLDREVAIPDLGLVGPIWTLDSLFNGDTVSSVAAGIVASLTFAEDGTVAIETGCNSGSARYLADEATGRIRFTEVLLTTRPCNSESAQLEGPIRAILDSDAVAMTLDEQTLRLMVGEQGLGFRGN